jgi:hypothetical protein
MRADCDPGIEPPITPTKPVSKRTASAS